MPPFWIAYVSVPVGFSHIRSLRAVCSPSAAFLLSGSAKYLSFAAMAVPTTNVQFASGPRWIRSQRTERHISGARSIISNQPRLITHFPSLRLLTQQATVPLMLTSFSSRLDRIVESLPRTYPGPGGAIAVLRDGELLVRHAWGWANAERRIPFTPRTLFRMCSITKQFTCAAVLDAFPDPSVLDGDVRARLPLLEQAPPGALHLCHNQSGLRDYWAVAMLHGSPVEAPFGDTEATRVIAATRTLHSEPGARYSYVNQNFRILSDILQERTGRSFGELLRTRVFDPAGMDTALLCADTRAMPDGTEGYEGTPAGGFRAAENRIVWTGDAGLGASLDDMIAWERHIDATRDDPDALYSRLAKPVTFSDGNPAAYGFGLGRRSELGRPVTAHGGALRGWRSHRLYVPSERVSVVVMFNHLSDAHEAAVDVLAAVLGEDKPPHSAAAPNPDWFGTYTEPESG